MRGGLRLPASRRLSREKLPKQRGPFSLALEPTRDLLASLTNQPHDCFVVGFAAETQSLTTNAQRKLREKNCDLLVANDVSRPDLGMDSDENELVIFSPNDEPETLPRAKKTDARAHIVEKNNRGARKMFDKKNVTLSDS